MRQRLQSGLLCALSFFAAIHAFAWQWHWSNPFPHGNDVTGLVSFNGLTIQVADFGQLYASPDLHTWELCATGTTNALESATVFSNRLIVAGANGTILTSLDGLNYTHLDLATTNWLVGVAASPSLAVAVGDNAVIYTSPDSTNWIKQSKPPNVGANWLQGVAYGNGVFVTVGDGGYVATSTNGVNWVKRTTVAFGDLTYVGWINTPGAPGSFAKPAFVAVSDEGEAINSIDNGASWTSVANYTTTTNVLYSDAGNIDSRILVGDGELELGQIQGSKTSWKSQLGALAGNAPSWTYYCSLWDTNPAPQYLVSGQTGLTVSGTETNSAYSWTPLDNSTRSWIWDVATNAGLYIAVGANATVMTSGDGVSWQTEAIPNTDGVSITNTVLFGAGGTTNLLIAVGSSGATLLSTNKLLSVVITNGDGSLFTNTVSEIGLVWNPVPSPTTNDLQGICFFNGKYYISGGNGVILQSANGTTWTKLTTSTKAYISGLAADSNGLVAVGNKGTILTSPTGATWTSRTSGTTNWLLRVRNINGTFVAVGENGTILTSSTGSTWAKQTSGTTAWLNDVTAVSNTLFAVGNFGTVLASGGGGSWTNVPIITGRSLFGAATQNGQLVVAGDSGVILQTEILPPPTQLEFLDFEVTNGVALFLVAPNSLALDVQFTLDTSTDLVHWTTGPLLTLLVGPLLFYEAIATNNTPQFFRATLVSQ